MSPDIDMDIFSFSANGETLDGTDAVFPICNQGLDGTITYLGTGFFITHFGVFATAKHVLESAERPFILHFRPNSEYILRPISRADLGHRGDLAVGAVVELTDPNGEILLNPKFSLSSHIPSVTEVVSTFAYPESTISPINTSEDSGFTMEMNAFQYHGVVTQIELGGIRNIPNPVALCTINSLPGISGGPVFSPHGNGGVIGINSSGMQGAYHIVSLINELQFLVIDGVRMTPNSDATNVTIRDMIQLGAITVV